MSGARVLRPRSDVRYRNVGGEGVVILQDAGEVLAVNELGVRVLELMDESLSIAEIVGRLLEEFDAERADVEEDVSEFVRELLEIGVVEVVEEDREGRRNGA